jgi:hypothetical protein
MNNLIQSLPSPHLQRGNYSHMDGVLSPPRSPCRCAEYLSRILDLKGRLALLKRQEKSALDQAGKSSSLMRQVSTLEDSVWFGVPGYAPQGMWFLSCWDYRVSVRAAVMWVFLRPFWVSCWVSWLCTLINLRLLGTCLNPTNEDHQISERIAALERALRDTDTLWVDL